MSDCRHDAPNRGPDAGDMQTQRQQLDEQTREQMLDRLVDCLYSLEGDTDISSIDRCLEELDAAGAECEDFDVEQSLRDFHERFDAAFESSPKEVKKTVRIRRPLARIAIIAAALCAFMITAQASGLDILGAIARWTSEQFSFVKMGEEKDERQADMPYVSLQEALEESGVVEQLSPSIFPDGTELSDLLIRREEDNMIFSASYTLGEQSFFISVRKVFGVPYSEVEINDPNIEVYMVGGIEHHIMSDVKQIKATWNNGDWECYIAGNIAKDDLLMMIDSIYE